MSEEELNESIDRMAEAAFEDQSTTANPKEALISEIKDMIKHHMIISNNLSDNNHLTHLKLQK